MTQMGFTKKQEDDILSFLDDVQEIDQSTLDVTGPQYPYIQWVNGQANMKTLGIGSVLYTGGWFCPADQAPGGEMPGWTPGELTHSDSSTTEGFFSRDITVAMIQFRKGWMVDANGQTRILPWTMYDEAKGLDKDGSPTGRLQVLCLVKGLEDLGPFTLTLRGSIARAFQASRGESVVGTFKQLVLKAADDLNRKRGVKNKFAVRAFWLTVGPQRDERGAPIFTKVGSEGRSSQVTLPKALGLHKAMTPQEVAGLYVGRDLLISLNALYEEAIPWREAWDTEQPTTERKPAEPEPEIDLGDEEAF